MFAARRGPVAPEHVAHLESWLNLVTRGGRFRFVEGVVTELRDMTAAEYVGSDPLDLDHLSGR